MASVRGAITQVEKKRNRAYTPKQKKFLKLFAENEFTDAKNCAVKAGYKGGYWQLIDSLKNDIKEISESILVGAAPHAAASLVNIMTADKPVPNAQNKLSAAKEVLDRSGVVKVDKSQVQHEVSGGVFLLPVKHEIVELEHDDYIDAEDGEWEYVEEYEEEAG